ncbi:MAG: hypothetical protein LBB58_05135, partial [Cellulomonadaceae bacterium]|nr:hypothetical protein [Cellulomonadaceae bacterium]
MRKFKTFGMAVGMVVALAGCAGIASATEVGDAAQTISERSSEFQNLMLQYAIENDAAQLQIDILRQASISFDDIWIAYEAAFQCIQDAGGQIYHIEETHSNGIPTINYSFSGLPTEAADLC